MMELFSDDVLRNPFPFYASLREASPLLHEPSMDVRLVLDHATVKRVLTDHASFSSAVSPPGARTSQWFIFMDPPRHTKLRALVSKAFTPRTVAALEPRVRELSAGLLDGLRARGECDLMADYAVPLPLMVIAELLGAPLQDVPRLRAWGNAAVELAGTFAGGELAARTEQAFARATDEITPYVHGLLDERRERPRDDLLTRLQDAEVDGERLTRAEILGMFLLLVLAGHETTTNLIGNAVVCLLDHPDELARLRAQPALVPQAIEEVLRFRSPIQVMFRAPAHDLELHGQAIPKGARMLAVIGAANRDPAHFAEPDRFDSGRAPNDHIAFGHGIHFCLGAPLARMEARIALTDLLERLPGLRYATTDPWPPRRAFHVHGPSRLPLRFG